MIRPLLFPKFLRASALATLLVLLNCTWSKLHIDHSGVRTIQPVLPVVVNTDLSPRLVLSGGAEYRPQSSFGLDGPNPAGPVRNISLQLPKWSWSAGADQYFLRYFSIGFTESQDWENGRFGSSAFRVGFRNRIDAAFLQVNVFYSRQNLTQESRLALSNSMNPLLDSANPLDTSLRHFSSSLVANQFGFQITINSAGEICRCMPGLSTYSDMGTLASFDTLGQSLTLNLVQFGIRPALSVRVIDCLRLSAYFDNDWYFTIKSPIWNKLYYHWRTGTELTVDLKGF